MEYLYRYPNKLLYLLLHDIDKHADEIIQDILSKNPKTKRGIAITKDMLEKSLQTQAMMYIFAIYDFIACTASLGKGIDDLNKFDFQEDINHILQNIMMEENNGSFNNFAQKAEKLYDSTNNIIVKDMVSMTVKKYFLDHDVKLVGDKQHLVDKFFTNTNDKRKIKLIQAQKRIVKK